MLSEFKPEIRTYYHAGEAKQRPFRDSDPIQTQLEVHIVFHPPHLNCEAGERHMQTRHVKLAA